ncbi:MAG: prepilin-type N-terminal cleavage/methylation domain-containing protein [Candidatus Andersenbacteria bacterium]
MNKGFTLVELMVVVAISSILMMGMIAFMAGGLTQYRTTFLQSLADETARVQLKRMSHDIRSAEQSATGAFPIVEASPQKFIYYANTDNTTINRIRYELIGTDLVRGVTKPSGNPLTYNTTNEQVAIIARDVQNGANPVFYYYGSDYPSDTTPVPSGNIADITYISFTLAIDADTTQEPSAVVLQSQVQLRNLKTNL